LLKSAYTEYVVLLSTLDLWRLNITGSKKQHVVRVINQMEKAHTQTYTISLEGIFGL